MTEMSLPSLNIVLIKVKSAYEPSGSPGKSLSRFQQHEATRNIYSSLPVGMLVHQRVTLPPPPCIKFARTIYTYG